MFKTTKKIVASILAVMMLALMIPFSASAVAAPDGPYTVKFNCAPNAATEADKVGDYTFSLFKIADLNKTTGEYTVVSGLAGNTAIVNAVKAAYSSTNSQAIITACDAAYASSKSSFGTAATSVSFTSTETTKTATFSDAGIYYVYCTDKPSKVTSVTNSLVSLPYYSSNAWVTDTDTTAVNLATKVSTSPIEVTKTEDKIYVGDNDKTVTYTLSTSTVGEFTPATSQTNKYVIVDHMNAGLTLNESSITVKLDDAASTTLVKDTDYTVATNYDYTDQNGTAKTATFAIELTSSMLAKEVFYNANNVVVTYTADLNSTAALNADLENTDGLVYKISDSPEGYEPGPEVKVFTYGMSVKKVDGNSNSPLANAVFTVYTDANATIPLLISSKKVIATTAADGTANFRLEGSTTDFKFDADATYYVKETEAPANYNINDTVFTVSIDTTKNYTVVNGDTVKDYPVKVPQTGGMGTMMFTIGGAALIACAGVLFFIARRKKNCSK